jgi:hypothetical protein
MTKTIASLIAVVTLVAGLSAQDQKAAVPDLTGTWNMGLQGQHVIPVALTLDQKGRKLTGVILMPTQRAGETKDVSLAGEIVEAALTLSGTVEGAAEPTTIEIAGTLNDDGSMEGTLNGPHGKMPWTAERLKERKK